MNTQNLIITCETGRIDQILAQKLQLTRNFVQNLLKNEKILVNGTTAKANYHVRENDKITITIPERKPSRAIAENINLEIIFEDEDVLVVNKPQGMVVHPANGHQSGTLVNALLFHVKDLAPNSSSEFFRPGIVHRLDKDTSGLLMVAKNTFVRLSLEKQLREHSVLRRYIALVHGDFTHKKGVIEAPIGRSKNDPFKQAVVENGKHAVTHFEVLERFGNYSLLKLQLETGRTHQIRVHLAYINHPVAGDPIYGLKNTLAGHGQFLHAQILGFLHPRKQEFLKFSIEPPKIFQETLTKLRTKNKVKGGNL